MKANHLVKISKDSSSAPHVWNRDYAFKIRSEWCFWQGWSLRITEKNDVTILDVFNPYGSELEIIALGKDTPQTRPIPIEAAHCLLNLFATDSDRAFYGNIHMMLEDRERIELPTGAVLQKLSILYVNLISKTHDRRDFMFLRGIKP